jgi:hypothetical protein
MSKRLGEAAGADQPFLDDVRRPIKLVGRETVASCMYVCLDCQDKLWYRALQRLKPLSWGIKRRPQLSVDNPLFEGDPTMSISWMVLHTGHRIERLE